MVRACVRAPRLRPPSHHHRLACAHPPRTPFPQPRSAWTNKLIEAKDHGSVQINIGHLDASGVYRGNFTTFAIIGKMRAQVGRGGGRLRCAGSRPCRAPMQTQPHAPTHTAMHAAPRARASPTPRWT